MLKQIICAIDFSDSSDLVLSRAKFMQVESNAKITLIHSAEKSQIEFLNFIFNTQEELSDIGLSELESKLAVLKTQLSTIEKEVNAQVAIGSVEEILTQQAKTLNASLIIIGASNKSDMQRTFLGSNALKILRHSNTSVLVAKNKASQQYQRILVGVDLSSNARPIISFIQTFAPEAEITLAHCYEIPFEGKLNHHLDDNNPQLAAYRQDLRNDAVQKLALIAHESSLDPLKSATLVTQGDPAEMLLQLAHDHACDLIVLNKNNETIFTKWILGSVTNEVVNLSAQDVLVFNQHKHFQVI